MLQVMEELRVDTTKWKAHSVRGTTASKALDKGATVEEIMKPGHWSSSSTNFTTNQRRKQTC